MSSTIFNKFLGVQPPSLSNAVFPNSTKKYYVFLPTAGLIPRKMNFTRSENAMNLKGYSPKVTVVAPGLILPDNIVLDVRLETYRQPRAPIIGDDRFLAKCPVSGWIRLHGVWLGYFDSTGKLVMIRRYTRGDLKKLIEEEKDKLILQLTEEELEHLKMFWFNNDNLGLDFMAHQGVKHSSFFCDKEMIYEQLPKYYNKLHSLTSPFFDGGDKDIRKILYNNGLRLGEYYNGNQLSCILKKAYGEYPCIRFKKEDGHPVLNDITFLYLNGEHPKLLEHPNYAQIPEGDFLFRSVDF